MLVEYITKRIQNVCPVIYNIDHINAILMLYNTFLNNIQTTKRYSLWLEMFNHRKRGWFYRKRDCEYEQNFSLVFSPQLLFPLLLTRIGLGQTRAPCTPMLEEMYQIRQFTQK